MARKNMLIWDMLTARMAVEYDGLGNDTSNKPVKYPSMGIKELWANRASLAAITVPVLCRY